LGIDAAAREVGVSRTAGRNWAKGYRKYRGGEVVGFVPALDRLEVREISSRFLSEDERVQIADLHRAGVSGREIARRLGRAPSTISRELRRNATAGKGVSAVRGAPSSDGPPSSSSSTPRRCQRRAPTRRR
jgi:IS30 family transposase